MDELGRHRERSADAERAERRRGPSSYPALRGSTAGRGNRYHVAAVADVDRVVGQKFIDLISDAIRVDRRRFRFEQRQQFFVAPWPRRRAAPSSTRRAGRCLFEARPLAACSTAFRIAPQIADESERDIAVLADVAVVKIDLHHASHRRAAAGHSPSENRTDSRR